MTHPLDNAYERVKRAREHLKEFQALHDDLCAVQAQATVVNLQTNVVSQTLGNVDLGRLVQVNVPTVEIPPRLRVLVGEVADGLRAALNYLVAQLAEHDSGAKVSGTQFPVEDIPDQFLGKRPVFLKGITDAHVARIEALQPYRGCNWTRPLVRLSNVHKHDDLVTILDHWVISTEGQVNPAERDIIHASVQMHIQATLRVITREGTLPVKETLEMLERCVAETLDAFKPEFK